MKRLLVAAVVVLGFASPAFASHCPKDAKLISAALEKQSNAEAQELLSKGTKLHEQGKHKESIEALHAAMKLLGIEH